MTLATDFTPSYCPWVGGWFASEKLFGCRAYWDGKEFWTRKGKIIKVPEYWKKELPTDVHLDGEIFAGRKNFDAAYAATEFGDFRPEVKFITFDCPSVTGNWLVRMETARKSVENLSFAGAVEAEIVKDEAGDAGSEYWEILMRFYKLGGEGVIFRNPNVTTYEVGRTKNCLREVFDSEMEMQRRWKLESKIISPRKLRKA